MIKLRELSHKYLYNAIYLLDHTKQSTLYVSGEVSQKKILGYICKLYDIMSKYTDVYFGYKPGANINKYATAANRVEEIKTGIGIVQELCRLTKVRVSVILRTDPKAQEILHFIFRKVTGKLQEYLVYIDYWNKEMMRNCYVDES